MYSFLSTEIPLESLLVDMQRAGWTSCKLQPPGEKYSQPRVLMYIAVCKEILISDLSFSPTSLYYNRNMALTLLLK